nr:hypothetical protein [Aneurinibacillus sp. XH2]
MAFSNHTGHHFCHEIYGDPEIAKKRRELYLQSRHSVPQTSYSNNNSYRLVLQDKDKRLSPSLGQARLPMKYEKNSYRSISWMSDRV